MNQTTIRTSTPRRARPLWRWGTDLLLLAAIVAVPVEIVKGVGGWTVTLTIALAVVLAWLRSKERVPVAHRELTGEPWRDGPAGVDPTRAELFLRRVEAIPAKAYLYVLILVAIVCMVAIVYLGLQEVAGPRGG